MDDQQRKRPASKTGDALGDGSLNDDDAGYHSPLGHFPQSNKHKSLQQHPGAKKMKVDVSPPGVGTNQFPDRASTVGGPLHVSFGILQPFSVFEQTDKFAKINPRQLGEFVAQSPAAISPPETTDASPAALAQLATIGIHQLSMEQVI